MRGKGNVVFMKIAIGDVGRWPLAQAAVIHGSSCVWVLLLLDRVCGVTWDMDAVHLINAP